MVLGIGTGSNCGRLFFVRGEGVKGDGLLVVRDHAELLVLSGEGGGDSKLHVDGGEGGEGVSGDDLLDVVGVGVDSEHAELLVLSGEGGGDSELHVVGGEGVRGDDLLGVS